MKIETMSARVTDLLDGYPTKFRKGGKHELMSRKQESQLFNVLHREYNIARMSIVNNGGNERRIIASTWEGHVIIDSTFTVY